MSILSLLYWVILVLSCIGLFPDTTFPAGRRIGWGAVLILLIIIGLRIFRMPIA